MQAPHDAHRVTLGGDPVEHVAGIGVQKHQRPARALGQGNEGRARGAGGLGVGDRITAGHRLHGVEDEAIRPEGRLGRGRHDGAMGQGVPLDLALEQVDRSGGRE